MGLIPSTGSVYLCREPVCGRFGIHRLLARLTTRELRVGWDGSAEITVVTFNRRRTICKILHVDAYGVDCTTRILNSGRFKVMLDEGSLPERLGREELEDLLNGCDTRASRLLDVPIAGAAPQWRAGQAAAAAQASR